ncbi:hypothetical protein [Nocardia sp. 2TAF39]|uniref:hypothetical protein n=1 Tax=Nocardia sp. 2TAF39 TaxID=3233017 RepID=UPI003F94D247
MNQDIRRQRGFVGIEQAAPDRGSIDPILLGITLLQLSVDIRQPSHMQPAGCTPGAAENLVVRRSFRHSHHQRMVAVDQPDDTIRRLLLRPPRLLTQGPVGGFGYRNVECGTRGRGDAAECGVDGGGPEHHTLVGNPVTEHTTNTSLPVGTVLIAGRLNRFGIIRCFRVW